MGTIIIGQMMQHATTGQILNRAAIEQNWFKEKMNELGHEVYTNLWNDFTIADYFGLAAIKRTYNAFVKAIKSWDEDKKRYVYNEKKLSELYIVLNWKLNTFYNQKNYRHQVYKELYDKCYNLAMKVLKGEQLTYFYETTD